MGEMGSWWGRGRRLKTGEIEAWGLEYLDGSPYGGKEVEAASRGEGMIHHDRVWEAEAMVGQRQGGAVGRSGWGWG